MLNRTTVVFVPLAVLSLVGTALGASKSASHRRVSNSPSLRGMVQMPKAGVSFHSMTQMPDSHLVAGYQSNSSGPAYTDVHGKVIGQMNLATGKVVWIKPHSARIPSSR